MDYQSGPQRPHSKGSADLIYAHTSLNLVYFALAVSIVGHGEGSLRRVYGDADHMRRVVLFIEVGDKLFGRVMFVAARKNSPTMMNSARGINLPMVKTSLKSAALRTPATLTVVSATTMAMITTARSQPAPIPGWK